MPCPSLDADKPSVKNMTVLISTLAHSSTNVTSMNNQTSRLFVTEAPRNIQIILKKKKKNQIHEKKDLARHNKLTQQKRKESDFNMLLI